MLSYLVFIVRFGFAVDLTNPPAGYTLAWIVFLLAHVVCSIALHTITLYLSCATAYIRYKTLKEVGSKWNHENAARYPIPFISSPEGIIFNTLLGRIIRGEADFSSVWKISVFPRSL